MLLHNKSSFILIAIFMLVTATSVYGTSDTKSSSIEVIALFKDKAMVSIEDKKYLLKVGGEEILGIKLIKSTSKYALLEIDGNQKKYLLGNRVNASYKEVEKKKVLIYQDGNGLFKTTGSINGYTVDFLVDTGASVIAMNSTMAKRLGLQYKLKGDKTIVSTASGKELAYSITLDQVKVGEILQRNIRAVVIDGDSPGTPLLGMSFLGRLNINNQGQQMSLEEKY